MTGETLLSDSDPGEWVPDFLEGCSRQTIPLNPDEEGPVSATLVRYDAEPELDSESMLARAPVLYLHGWTDYFFNLPLAHSWFSNGRPFYALDLRKYGRSLRPHQTPGYVEDLHEYDEEITKALKIIGSEHPTAPPPMMQAHSTGGLVAALWANRFPESLSALILNSPWLEIPGDVAARTAIEGVLVPLKHLNPKRPLRLPAVDNYWQTLSDEAYGEWKMHPLWRPRQSFPITAGWITAVIAGHKKVHEGLRINVPIMVLLSSSTLYQRTWSEELKEHDSVLDVELLARRATKLGRQVTVVRLEKALHDVFASSAPIRERAINEVQTWLRAYAPEAETLSTAPPYRRSR